MLRKIWILALLLLAACGSDGPSSYPKLHVNDEYTDVNGKPKGILMDYIHALEEKQVSRFLLALVDFNPEGKSNLCPQTFLNGIFEDATRSGIGWKASNCDLNTPFPSQADSFVYTEVGRDGIRPQAGDILLFDNFAPIVVVDPQACIYATWRTTLFDTKEKEHITLPSDVLFSRLWDFRPDDVCNKGLWKAIAPGKPFKASLRHKSFGTLTLPFNTDPSRCSMKNVPVSLTSLRQVRAMNLAGSVVPRAVDELGLDALGKDEITVPAHHELAPQIYDCQEKIYLLLKGSLPPEKENLVVAAQLSLMLANKSAEEGLNLSAQDYLNVTKTLLDLVVNFAPGISAVNDASAILVGYNLLGEKVSDEDRALAAAFIFAPSVLKGSAKGLLRLGEHLGLVAVLKTKSGKLAKFVMERLAALNISEVLTSANSFKITPVGLRVYGKLHKAIHNLPFGMKVQRIREGGDPKKIAIIGRKMGADNGTEVGVYAAALHLEKNGISTVKQLTFAPSKEAFDEFEALAKEYADVHNGDWLPPDIVRTTKSWAENKKWAEDLKKEGYTVLDIGNPTNNPTPSAFYQIELDTLFGN